MLEVLVRVEVLECTVDICTYCAAVIWQVFKAFTDFYCCCCLQRKAKLGRVGSCRSYCSYFCTWLFTGSVAELRSVEESKDCHLGLVPMCCLGPSFYFSTDEMLLFLCKHLFCFPVLWALRQASARSLAGEAFHSHWSKNRYGHTQTRPPEGN